MHIVFSDHALLKINQRVLSREKILETVLQPEMTESGHHSRIKLYRKFGRKYLQVVTMRTLHTVIIVTAHWVVKLPKE